MPVAVQMPNQRQKRDPLDTIMAGLNIATTVFGIKEGADKARLLAEQQKVNAENDKFSRMAKEAELGEKGYSIERDDDGNVVALKPPGSSSIDNQEKAARTNKMIAETEAIKRGRYQGDPEMRALRMEQIRAQTQGVKDRFDEAKSRTMDAQAERLSNKIQNAGELNSDINLLEKKLGFNLENYNAEKDDVPGVSLPLVGRTNFYSGDARELDKTVSRIFNVELRDRSGAAVTNNELNRLRKEFGAGLYNSEAELLGALRDYKNAFRDLSKNIEAGYPPEVVALRGERGGFTSAAISQPGTLRPPDQEAPQSDSLSVLRPPTANAQTAPRVTPPPMPKKIMQGGIEFILNERTGQYE